MHLLGLILWGLIASFWIFYGLHIAYGALRLPTTPDSAPASDADCPRISILRAARDEKEKLLAALATLMEINYPNLEVVAVDDRSKDATGRILDEFAATHSRLRVVHVAELPAGWLGKPHALQKAYEAATGEWLLFTDADVRFKPDVLRRAVAFARQQNLDHLSLFCDVEMVGFWEKAFITFFVAVFHLATNPRLVGNHGSPFYVGIGVGHGWIRIFAAIALVITLCFYSGTAASMRVSPLYSLTYPLGAMLLSYMLLRSAVVTLKQGGIIWRDTFYPLEELKRGLV